MTYSQQVQHYLLASIVMSILMKHIYLAEYYDKVGEVKNVNNMKNTSAILVKYIHFL